MEASIGSKRKKSHNASPTTKLIRIESVFIGFLKAFIILKNKLLFFLTTKVRTKIVTDISTIKTTIQSIIKINKIICGELIDLIIWVALPIIDEANITPNNKLITIFTNEFVKKEA